jgi:hypothetical protein
MERSLFRTAKSLWGAYPIGYGENRIEDWALPQFTCTHEKGKL